MKKALLVNRGKTQGHIIQRRQPSFVGAQQCCAPTLVMLQRWGLVLVFLVAMLLSLVSGNNIALAQESKTFEWQRLDVDLSVLQNGDIRVVEKNVIRFTSGRFTFGYRDIKQDRLTGITDIKVTEGAESSAPIRFEKATSDSGDFRIKYYFATPAQNEVRTITLAYTVSGALRYYEGGDQLYWAAIYANRNGFPVKRSLITVNLPNGLSATKAETSLPSTIVAEAGDQTLTIESKDAIPSGQEMEVRVQFLHGVIQGQPAAWQKAFDEQRTYDETVRPRNDLLALLASLLTFIGGPALAVVTWVTRGRDPHVGVVAEYLTEPPNISPGIAGTLIDEKADMQDIIATFIDLARRGVITMQEEKESERSASLDYLISPGPNFATSKLKPHEQTLLAAINLGDQPKAMSSFKNKLFSQIPKIKTALYAQMVGDGFYTRDPDSTRNRWSGIGFTMLIGAFAVGCGSIFTLGNLTNYAICIPIGLVLTAIIFLVMAKNMPQRTREGADMKMRIEAFKRYLQNIEKYVNLKEATDQFDKYLPFAIAFGIDRSWVQKFSRVETPAPPWYIPYGYGYGNGYGYGRHTGSVGGNRGIGDVLGGQQKGDVSGAARTGSSKIEGLNTGLAIGLASINTNMTGMFQSVSNTFTSQPAPVVSSSGGSWSSSGSSGGGWSGGGGGGGGSSGGGGGGFG